MADKEALTKELKWLAAGFAVLVVVLKIAYYRENILTVAKTAAAIYWLLVIPGYAMMLSWKHQLGFLERTFLGTVAAIAITGIASYYLGLAGLKLQSQTIALPLTIISASFAAYLAAARQQEQAPQQQKA